MYAMIHMTSYTIQPHSITFNDYPMYILSYPCTELDVEIAPFSSESLDSSSAIWTFSW